MNASYTLEVVFMWGYFYIYYSKMKIPPSENPSGTSISNSKGVTTSKRKGKFY